eukprot:7938086-Prorocentrum_lima.AAC.1
MTSSLVGSEMCIRDRRILHSTSAAETPSAMNSQEVAELIAMRLTEVSSCLLYTSDAADDM